MARVKDRALDAAETVEAEMTITDAPEAAAAATADLVTMAQITVTQLPIIEERLRDVKAAVEATVAEAKTMVAMADTVQTVKTRRAELNKQFNAIEEQRKAIKAQIAAPYQKFEAVYKECIAGPFREADAALKSTVDEFEGALKADALQKLEEYYAELCSLEGIDFVSFQKAMELAGIKISLADCRTSRPRKAMDSLANFTSRIGLGLDAVRKMDDSAEIMVEFKKCLDAGQAAATVSERKRKAQEEAEAEQRRKESEFETRRKEMIAKVEAFSSSVVITAAPEPLQAPTPAADPTRSVTAGGEMLSFRFLLQYTGEQRTRLAPRFEELKRILKDLQMAGVTVRLYKGDN